MEAPPHPMAPNSTDEDYYLGKIKLITEEPAEDMR